MTSLQAAKLRLEAYALSYASPYLVVGDDISVAQQVERDRRSGDPPEVLHHLLDNVVDAVRAQALWDPF